MLDGLRKLSLFSQGNAQGRACLEHSRTQTQGMAEVGHGLLLAPAGSQGRAQAMMDQRVAIILTQGTVIDVEGLGVFTLRLQGLAADTQRFGVLRDRAILPRVPTVCPPCRREGGTVSLQQRTENDFSQT